MGSLGVVALFNANLDALVPLGKLLESAGFDVVSAPIPEVRDGRCDATAIMERHDPAVVVYDIGPPYEENWKIFQLCRATSMRDRRFVITSANPAHVERLAGRDERIFEIVDTPFDLDDIVHAVKEAATAASRNGRRTTSTRNFAKNVKKWNSSAGDSAAAPPIEITLPEQGRTSRSAPLLVTELKS
jgi:DNA-binding response OmpR family regulator